MKKIFLPIHDQARNKFLLIEANRFIFEKSSKGELNLKQNPNLKLLAWKLSSNGLLPENHLNTETLEIIDGSRVFLTGQETTQIKICLNDSPNFPIFRNKIFLDHNATSARDLILPNPPLDKKTHLVFTLKNQQINHEIFYEPPASSFKIDFRSENEKTGKEMTVLGSVSSGGIFKIDSEMKPVHNWIFAVNSTQNFEVFQLKSPKPSATEKQFNSLISLNNAFSTINWLNSKLNDSILYLAPANSEGDLKFSNQNGKFVESINFKDKDQAKNRFFNVENLAKILQKQNALNVRIENDTKVEISAKNANETLIIQARPAKSAREILEKFGLKPDKNDEVILEPSYALENGKNLWSKSISAQFEISMEIFNQIGKLTNVKMSFLKIEENLLIAEIFLENQLLAQGEINVDENGQIEEISENLQGLMKISPQKSFNLQFETENCEKFGEILENDGVKIGKFKNFKITKNGFVFSEYENGISKLTHKIPAISVEFPEFLQEQEEGKFIYSPNFAAGFPFLEELEENFLNNEYLYE